MKDSRLEKNNKKWQVSNRKRKPLIAKNAFINIASQEDFAHEPLESMPKFQRKQFHMRLSSSQEKTEPPKSQIPFRYPGTPEKALNNFSKNCSFIEMQQYSNERIRRSCQNENEIQC